MDSTLTRPVYRVTTVQDAYTDLVSEWFDLKKSGESTFEGYSRPEVGAFSIGLIVGPSGSGKSLLLRQFGTEDTVKWDDTKAIISQLASLSNADAEAVALDSIVRKKLANHEPLTEYELQNHRLPEARKKELLSEAMDRFIAVGFNDVRSYVRPYHVLSTGEKFRADLARRLKDGAVIDEFTSVVDRNVAKAAAKAIRRYATKHNLKNVVFASCHSDIIEWLQPDWYFDTSDGTLHDGRLLRCPQIVVRFYPCKRSAWPTFAPHHYLSHVIGSSAKCFLATASIAGIETVVGFSSSRPLPSGTLKNAWIEHRTVVLPDFQGLGIGPRLSDSLASIHKSEGKRFYSKTAHPRMGDYRDAHPMLWKPTSKYNPTTGKKLQRYHGDSGKADPNSPRWTSMINDFGGDTRQTFSHEYIGP